MQRNLRTVSIWFAGLILACLTSACQPVQPVAETVAPKVVIELTNEGINIPDTLPAGIVTVTFQNNATGEASPSLGWLVEGKTFEEFEAAMQSDDFAAIMQIAVPVGGPYLKEGESEDVAFDLKAGDVLVVNFPEEGVPQIARSVAEESGQAATAPEAEYQMDMDEFSFVMPDEIAAGPHLWQINNVGEQWHEFVVFKPNEGATIEDLIELVQMEEEPEGPLAFEEIAYFSSMGGNTTAWTTLDLPAGEYYVVCFLPDVSDEEMASHLEHGMVRTLVVK